MEIISISGQLRTELGKKGSKSTRKKELIPCVLYGGGQAVHFSTTFNEVRSLIYTADFKVASIALEDQSVKAIVKDVQFHPLTDEIIHIDFLRLVKGHPIKVELPIRFTGVSPGVKLGGRLVQQLRKIKVKTIPEKLVHELTLDISTLEMGQAIRVRDIDIAEGIEIINQPSIPVASVQVPRALKAEEGEEEEEGTETPEAAEATEE